MAFFGVIKNAAQGVKRTYDLPRLIQNAELKVRTPIITKFHGVERFEAASKLIEADVFRPETGVIDRVKLIEGLDKLEKEFRMAEDQLSRQPATKKDVVALGIVVREMAAGYDLAVEAFEDASRASLDQFADENRTLLERSDLHFRSLAESTTKSLTERMNAKEREISDQLAKRQHEYFAKIDTQLKSAVVRTESATQDAVRNAEKKASLLESKLSRQNETALSRLKAEVSSTLSIIRRDYEAQFLRHDVSLSELVVRVERGLEDLEAIRHLVETRVASAEEMVNANSRKIVETELAPLRSALQQTTKLLYGLGFATSILAAVTILLVIG